LNNVFPNASPQYGVFHLIFETKEMFLKAKKKHSAVESAIGALQNHGVDICPDKGFDGFLRYVDWYTGT